MKVYSTEKFRAWSVQIGLHVPEAGWAVNCDGQEVHVNELGEHIVHDPLLDADFEVYEKWETNKCPMCGKLFDGYPALSRNDNETEICPECGQYEALRDAIYGMRR